MEGSPTGCYRALCNGDTLLRFVELQSEATRGTECTTCNDKIAVVTGATRGIGEASARALDAAGARVVLTGRTVSDLHRVASELSNDPVVLESDLSPPKAGTELAERVLEAVGGVDILVNNAGIPMRRTPDQLTEEDFDLVFSINVRSLLMLTLGLGPSMIERGGGSIINISSIASLRGPARPRRLRRHQGRRRCHHPRPGRRLGCPQHPRQLHLPRPDRHRHLGTRPPEHPRPHRTPRRRHRPQALGLRRRRRRRGAVLRHRSLPLRHRRSRSRGRRHGPRRRSPSTPPVNLEGASHLRSTSHLSSSRRPLEGGRLALHRAARRVSRKSTTDQDCAFPRRSGSRRLARPCGRDGGRDALPPEAHLRDDGRRDALPPDRPLCNRHLLAANLRVQSATREQTVAEAETIPTESEALTRTLATVAELGLGENLIELETPRLHHRQGRPLRLPDRASQGRHPRPRRARRRPQHRPPHRHRRRLRRHDLHPLHALRG